MWVRACPSRCNPNYSTSSSNPYSYLQCVHYPRATATCRRINKNYGHRTSFLFKLRRRSQWISHQTHSTIWAPKIHRNTVDHCDGEGLSWANNGNLISVWKSQSAGWFWAISSWVYSCSVQWSRCPSYHCRSSRRCRCGNAWADSRRRRPASCRRRLFKGGLPTLPWAWLVIHCWWNSNR